MTGEHVAHPFGSKQTERGYYGGVIYREARLNWMRDDSLQTVNKFIRAMRYINQKHSEHT